MPWSKGQGVVEAGENNVQICMKTVETSNTVCAFTAADRVGELTDFSGIGGKRDTKEIDGYHYDSKVKKLGNSTPNDISMSENLTLAQVAIIRGYYNSKQLLGIGWFADGTLGYGFTGRISEWGEEIPNGDTCKLTYTVAVDNDNVAHTYTAASGGGD